MCGTMNKSTSPTEAVEFSLAYAKHWMEDQYEYGPDDVRYEAGYFIRTYVPQDQRDEALSLLAQRNDDHLFTELTYDGDVVR